MGFGQFLAAPEHDIKIVTHRDIFQNTALESSRGGEEYISRSAVIKLDENDIKKMGLKAKGRAVLKNSSGRVVVTVEKSEYEEAHEGIGYMTNSPWSNALVSADTNGTGVPKFKMIIATISDGKDEKITSFDI
ncbi:molybdopterin dinucleotide binding domain-containing protein [Methanococcoides sp. LMO-2]|uniref:Molybdopterin dinucleotide binding domain-containing protein n=1 Tax=Methanococcoides cohabitans TaxID=3136559 RepID=A0ABU9KTR3_9EURY